MKEKKKPSKGIIILTILAILLFIIVASAILSTSMENDKNARLNAEFGNLEEIYHLHAQNVPKAEKIYKNKYFKFTGKITHIYNNYLQIESNYISADVYFDSDYKEKAKNLNVNDTITYSGRVDFGMSIIVRDAIIVKED